MELSEWREELAGVIGRARDGSDHSPMCSDEEPCRYCTPIADAVLASPAMARLLAEARAGALRNPYDEDGYCEGCGNGSWKPHAPECGWADLRESRAQAWESAIHHVEPHLSGDVKRAAMRDNPFCAQAESAEVPSERGGVCSECGARMSLNGTCPHCWTATGTPTLPTSSERGGA